MQPQKHFGRLLLLGCMSVSTAGVHAQAVDPASKSGRTKPDYSGLDEIVVTATRREEVLSKVPLSIVATDQEMLDKQGIRSADDLMRLTPSITFGPSSIFYGTGQSNIAIRGIQSTSGLPTTGVYIDDTPVQSRTGISPSLTNAYPKIFDLDRVEVLRGPQGTLFGTGAMGGAVRFITPEPAFKDSSLYARSELSTTHNGSTSYEGGVAGGTPLIEDTLGFRASLWYRKDGGYVDRLDRRTKEVTQRDINDEYNYVARVALGWKPTDNLTVTPSLFFQKSTADDGAIFEVATSDPANADYRTSFYAQPQAHYDRFYLPALKVTWDFDSVSLISNTSYFTRKTTTESDDVALNIAIWSGYSGPFPPPDLPLVQSGTHNATSQSGVTQEIRLQSTNPGRFNWVVGAFFNRAVTNDFFAAENRGLLEQINYGVVNAGGQPIGSIAELFGVDAYQGLYVIYQKSKYTDSQTALFAQADYEIVPRLKLTGGLRYTASTFRYDNFIAGPLYTTDGASVILESKGHPVTPKLGLSFQADNNNLFYANAAKGARGNGVADAVGFRCADDAELLGFDANSPHPIKSDSLWSYEVGSKNQLLNGHLAIDASAYHVDWKDVQTVIALPYCQNHAVVSLGDAKIDGVDLALSVRPLRGMTLGASVSYIDARYSTELRGPVNNNEQVIRRKGEPMDVAPWSMHFSGEYEFSVNEREWYARADYTRTTHDSTPQDLSTPLTDPMLPRAPATAVLDLRAGTRLGGLDLSLFVNNVTNDHPLLSLGHETPTDPNFRTTSFRPRTIGITATFRR